MTTGTLIGLLLMIVAIFLNYIILFTIVKVESTYDYDKQCLVENQEKLTHWRLLYYVSWIWCLIPFFGFFIELLWILILGIANEGGIKSTCKLFDKV